MYNRSIFTEQLKTWFIKLAPELEDGGRRVQAVGPEPDSDGHVARHVAAR
jgi:hypothetical protein